MDEGTGGNVYRKKGAKDVTTRAEVMKLLRQEVGFKFTNVLEHCGVLANVRRYGRIGTLYGRFGHEENSGSSKIESLRR